jgi:diguanylate cyclase (GGDEF)-like protein
MSVRYLDFSSESSWKIAIETWVMIAFITWVLLQTGRLESPLVNLYLLVIITTALTLGNAATLLQIALIGACHIWLSEPHKSESMSLYFAALAARLGPMILVAYITTMLAQDIRHALLQIKLLSERDELTGVLNMRAFGAVAERMSRQAARYGQPYAVLMLDSDSLKVVNDRYGHEAGNRLIKLMVKCVQGQLRDTDLLARYGGDEFIVLLPQTTAEGAETVATRVRQLVEAAVLTTDERPVNATVSIGVASYPEHGRDLPSVMERADQALYASKAGGRNRVTVAPSRPRFAALAA